MWGDLEGDRHVELGESIELILAGLLDVYELGPPVASRMSGLGSFDREDRLVDGGVAEGVHEQRLVGAVVTGHERVDVLLLRHRRIAAIGPLSLLLYVIGLAQVGGASRGAAVEDDLAAADPEPSARALGC